MFVNDRSRTRKVLTMASRTVSFSAILSVVAALTCPICGVHAAPEETAFPAAGGDLASPEAWGGTLPGPEAHLKLTNAGT